MNESPDTRVDAGSVESLRRTEAAELARRFPGVVAWFGDATREWWAMVNGRLVEARGLYDLGRLITDALPLAPAKAVGPPAVIPVKAKPRGSKRGRHARL